MHNMCGEVDRLRLFVMDCGITQENKKRLTAQASRFGNVEIIFHNIECQLEEITAKVENNWNKAIYGRLFFTEILNLYDDIDRLVYLDCDIIVDKPVTELFEMDLRGKCLAGVVDGYGAVRKKALGIAANCNYINSGVLVIDTAKWVELEVSARIIEYINGSPEMLIFPDQDAINYILCGDIMRIHPKYNMMWMLCDRDIPKLIKNIEEFKYTYDEIYDALHNGCIYHYAAHDMWSFGGITPIQSSIFVKYRNLCDWRECSRSFKNPAQLVTWLTVSAKKMLCGDWK